MSNPTNEELEVPGNLSAISQFDLDHDVRRSELNTNKSLASRRNSFIYPALDVIAGGFWDVRIFERDIVRKAGIDVGRAKEAAFCTQEVLKQPRRVYQGLRDRGEDEWLCYCGIPLNSYHPNGTPRPPKEDRLFLVYVNCDRVAYDWSWVDCNPDHTAIPVDYLSRFKRQVYPCPINSSANKN